MVRIALVGCGSHSEKEHAASLGRYARQHPDEVELAAACDLDRTRAEKFCRKYGFARAYDDVERMLDAEKIDGCVSVMPVDRIVSMAEMLLERGIPCVMEKPPGATLDEVRALAETARRTGTPHMVSVNRRFHPFLNRAIEWTRSVGTVRYIRAAMLRTERNEPNFIWGTALHAVDAMRHIAGTEVIRYSSQALDFPEITGEWYIVSFEFGGGVSGRLDILPSAGRTEETYELFGENFSASFSSSFWKENRLVCRRSGSTEIDEHAVDEPHEIASGAFEETSSFITALRRGTPMAPTLDDVLPSLEICHAMTQGVFPQ